MILSPAVLPVTGAAPPSFAIALVPNQGEDDGNHVAVLLKCTYTPTYPEELPTFEVEVIRGLNGGQRDEVAGIVQASAEENLGMGPIVFTVAESIKEWLLANNREPDDDSMYAKMMAREKKVEEELQRVASEAAAVATTTEAEAGPKNNLGTASDGSLTTPELFKEWNAKFMAELAASRTDEDLQTEAERNKKLTGRQLFEQNASLFSRETLLERALAGGAGDESGDGVGGYGNDLSKSKVPRDGEDGWDGAIREDLYGDDANDLDDLDDMSSEDDGQGDEGQAEEKGASGVI